MHFSYSTTWYFSPIWMIGQKICDMRQPPCKPTANEGRSCNIRNKTTRNVFEEMGHPLKLTHAEGNWTNSKEADKSDALHVFRKACLFCFDLWSHHTLIGSPKGPRVVLYSFQAVVPPSVARLHMRKSILGLFSFYPWSNSVRRSCSVQLCIKPLSASGFRKVMNG